MSAPRRQPHQIRAPWTTEQAAALNAYQREEWWHPFTCPAPQHKSEVKLVATTYGWICGEYPDCTYTQDWAWRFMLEGKPAHG
jgi:hypothetical protein